MRNRKILIGALLGAAGALSLAGTASAAVTSATLTTSAFPAKQKTKTSGGVALNNEVATTFVGATPALQYTPPANKTVLTFDPNFKFDAGNLPQCSAATLAGKTTAQATAACPGSVLGTGSAVVNTQSGLTIPGVVTQFNGTKSGPNLTILLHTDLGAAVPTKPILTGVLSGGRVLTVAVPVTPGTVISDFKTATNKLKVGKKKVKGSNKKVPKYYIEATCKTGKWTHSQVSTYTDGSTHSSSSTQTCKKVVEKKK
jgi:hypothetical protein